MFNNVTLCHEHSGLHNRNDSSQFLRQVSALAMHTYEHITGFKIMLYDTSVKIFFIKDVHDRVLLVVEERKVQCVYNH